MSDTIAKLEELLDLNETILSTKIKCLTAPGENYGSLMLSVDVKTEKQKRNFVAKTLPPNLEMQEMFNCPVTFRNEIGLYKVIVPTLRRFQREHGVENVINFVAKYHGSRANLHRKNENIDGDAVLLLENLKISGFVNLERTIGFDFDGAKLVLRDLAELHGVALALKIQEPKVFDRDIRAYFTPFVVPKEVRDDWERKYLKLVSSVPQIAPLLDRMKKVSIDIYPPPPPRELFGTLSHNDCWVNNIMVRLDGDKVVESKLVDFQLFDYGSPAKDVLFFLFSSVQNQVLREHCDGLLQFYHTALLEILLEMKCDTKQFGFKEFQKELDIEARQTQFMLTVLMLFPIFAPKLDVKDMSEVKPSDIGNEEPSELLKEKLVVITEEFAKRNWI